MYLFLEPGSKIQLLPVFIIVPKFNKLPNKKPKFVFLFFLILNEAIIPIFIPAFLHRFDACISSDER